MTGRSIKSIKALLVCSDAGATAAAWMLAYFVRFHSGILPAPLGVPHVEPYLMMLPFMAVLWPAALKLSGAYTVKRGHTRRRENTRLARAILAAAVALFSVDAFLRLYGHPLTPGPPDTGSLGTSMFQYSRLTIALFLPLNFMALQLSRAVVRHGIENAYRKGYDRRRVLVMGSGELGCRLVDFLRAHDEFGYEIAGFVDDETFRAPFEHRGVPVLGCLEDTAALVTKHNVHEVFVALPFEAYGRAFHNLNAVGRECVDIRIVPDLLQYSVFSATVDDIGGLPVINLDESPQQGLSFLGKRLFDAVVASTFLLFGFPLLLTIAAAIRLTSRGPVLYRQERMGLDGRPFMMLKFRTMEVDAERETGPIWASEDDPRRTRLGAFLRRQSIDELPQFINVLRGEMSVVGPRPERPEFVREFKTRFPHYMMRHKVKAGITGWAQVHGWRGNTSLEKRIDHDLFYIENWSLVLDVKIMFLTLVNGLAHRNAY